MQSMQTEVSEQDIEREIKTLKGLRRRSASSPGPGALPLDPDLPPPSPNGSSRSSYQSLASPSYSSNDDITLSTPDGLDDGSLFWVPAHLHPELAPGEFRAFLKSHTHADPESADASDAGEAPGLGRSPSWLARRDSRKGFGGDGGLGRKRSMLSKQYHPRHGDQIEEEDAVPPVPDRQRASIYGGRSGEKGLTLQDLQKLEELVDQAEETDDPAQMRQLLRRSLSTNVAPGFLQDDIPQGADEADEPVIVPRPGSIIRRSARTRIRKPNLVGDGGGHRFGATRRGGRLAPSPGDSEHQQRKSSDGSSESHDVDEHFVDAVQHIENRRESDASTEEGVIFDAYRNSRASSISSESGERSRSTSPDELEDARIGLPPIMPSFPSQESDWFGESQKTPTQETVRDPMSGFRRPSPGAELGEGRPGLTLPSGATLGVPVEAGRSTSPSSPTSPTTPQQKRASSFPPPGGDLPPGMAPPIQRSAVPPGFAIQHQRSLENIGPTLIDNRPPLARADSSASVSTVASATSLGKDKEKEKEKEKEKKSGFFSKKDKKDKEKDKDAKKKEKDGLFGGLFNKGKKVQEEPSSVANFSSAGPAAAAALLGSSKSAKSIGLSAGPSPTTPGFSQFARYPIHVERAVYRLSHIKLANARRPLYEQVLISNLMFWYLGVIGRNVAEEKKVNGEEKKEEPAKPAVKGTPPKALDVGSAGVPPPRTPDPPREREKKVGLSKPERSRASNAEAPVRPPQYGMQHAQVDSEMRQAKVQNYNAQTAARGGPQQSPPLQHYQNSQYALPPGAQMGVPPQRAATNPLPPNATRTTPPPGGGQRPGSEIHANQPSLHRDLQGPPRGVPQSSFGPPPPVNGQLQSFDNRDSRQRTLSNPQQGSQPGAVPPGGQMRRVVTDGRPYPECPSGAARNGLPQPPGSHGGPQPGQIFQYPGALGTHPGQPFPPRPMPMSAHPQPAPGQIFPPQPGQIFHHPPQHHYTGPPPPHLAQGHPSANGSRPLPEVAQVERGWQPPARLPGPPGDGWGGPANGRAPSPMDPRAAAVGRGYPPQGPHLGAGMGPPQFYGPPGARPGAGPGSGPGRGLQPGQVVSPFPGPPGQEGYRRAQPVPGTGQYGGHHR